MIRQKPRGGDIRALKQAPGRLAICCRTRWILLCISTEKFRSCARRLILSRRGVDDAAMLMVRFANGSVGTLEVSRYGVGCRNRNAFEINGSKGMIRFDLENMNRLEFFDATQAPNLQASRNLLVTGPDHPYSGNFWKPGHEIGYEHTFIATLGDFLQSLERGQRFRPNFDDGVAVHRILDAVEKSTQARAWIKIGDA